MYISNRKTKSKQLLQKEKSAVWQEESIRLFENRFPTLFSSDTQVLNVNDVIYIGHITNNVIANLLPDSVAMKAICFRPMRTLDKTSNIKKQRISASQICHRHLIQGLLKFVESTNNTHIYAEMSRRVLSSLKTGNVILDEIFRKLSKLESMPSFILVTDLEDKAYTGKEFYIRFVEQSYHQYIQSINRRNDMIKELSDFHYRSIACYNCHPSWLGVTAYTLHKKVPRYKWGSIPESMSRMVTRRHNHPPKLIVQALSTEFTYPNVMKTYRYLIRRIWFNLEDKTLTNFYDKLYDYQSEIINTYINTKEILPSFYKLRIRSEPFIIDQYNKNQYDDTQYNKDQYNKNQYNKNRYNKDQYNKTIHSPSCVSLA